MLHKLLRVCAGMYPAAAGPAAAVACWCAFGLYTSVQLLVYCTPPDQVHGSWCVSGTGNRGWHVAAIQLLVRPLLLLVLLLLLLLSRVCPCCCCGWVVAQDGMLLLLHSGLTLPTKVSSCLKNSDVSCGRHRATSNCGRHNTCAVGIEFDCARRGC